jgi:zinc/manganese transport system permease protein
MALSAGLALASVWIGIALSYHIAALPPSSAIVLVAGGFYLLAFAAPPRRVAGVLRWMR